MNKKMLDEEEDDLFSLSGSSMGKKGRAVAHIAEPRQRMPFESRNEGSKCVGTRFRAWQILLEYSTS